MGLCPPEDLSPHHLLWPEHLLCLLCGQNPQSRPAPQPHALLPGAFPGEMPASRPLFRAPGSLAALGEGPRLIRVDPRAREGTRRPLEPKLPAPAKTGISPLMCSTSIYSAPTTIVIKRSHHETLALGQALGPTLRIQRAEVISGSLCSFCLVECFSTSYLQLCSFVPPMSPQHGASAGCGTSQVDETHPGLLALVGQWGEQVK